VAKFVLRSAAITINGTALSDHCSSITFEDKANEVDFTSFTPNAYTEQGQGLRDATITASFFQDYAAASVHAILQPLYASGGTFTVKIWPDQTTSISATNPSVTMTARGYSYAGISGKVGDAAAFDFPMRNAGTAGPVWGTT
jgi:hypothetical protein